MQSLNKSGPKIVPSLYFSLTLRQVLLCSSCPWLLPPRGLFDVFKFQLLMDAMQGNTDAIACPVFCLARLLFTLSLVVPIVLKSKVVLIDG
jgi:hypothetical protein